MVHFYRFSSLEEAASLPAVPLHLAIGMFDGVHLGHRAVIDPAIQSARHCGGLAGVLTFWPHPSSLFRPENPTKSIISAEIKEGLVREAGADVLIAQTFTPEFAQIEPEFFIPHLKHLLPKLAAIYVGENWRFGRGRRGNIALLIAEARKHDLEVVSVQRINVNGDPISSTRIRECLAEGEIEKANYLLGYTYFAHGVVTPGKGLGQKIGFPTLNIPWNPELKPRFGVYAMRVWKVGSAKVYRAVANFGLRPTVEQTKAPRLEIHVLGPCPLGTGDEIRADWLHFLRPEEKFSDVGALTAQIAKDRAEAETYFAK